MHPETRIPDCNASNHPAPRQYPYARRALTGAVLILTMSCGLAQAADVLTEAQLDQVSAGYQTSGSAASASALFGFATTSSNTYASSIGSINSSSSTSAGVAGGIGADAMARAATWYH